MKLADASVRSFARHETFHPRYGWFRKAYAVAAADPYAFGREDAPVVIGVGKNMVRAIRFWGLAAKLIVEDPHSPNRRAPQFVPTRRGHALFGDQGWDPYMEDPGTLWLLHWLLLAPPSRLPVWWLAFNEFNAVEFCDADLAEAVSVQLDAVADWTPPHESSVKKDLGALLRTYAPAEHSRRGSIDDLLDCPLRELNLLGRSRATGLNRFTLGPKPTLPPAIVAYAVLDYIDRTGSGGRTVTLGRLTHEPGTPGRAFKLNETELLAALKPAVDRTDGLDLTTPAGAWQLACAGDPSEVATAVLDHYYGTPSSAVGAGCVGDAAVDDNLLEDLGVGRNSRDSLRSLNALARVT
ncbi:MAG: DUF4007 family protein [Acidimicrobiaceae bacterium]|nr:DUF4007 family protein [Acidimicrobiaceae bacterium]